jgi:hypothetical protein
MLPFFTLRLQLFREAFPTLPFDCPAKPGKYSGNFTMTSLETFNEKNATSNTKTLMTTTTAKPGETQLELPLPNGIYKNVIHLSTKDDPEGFSIMWQFDTRIRLGEEEF